jgi:hypothetical protein
MREDFMQIRNARFSSPDDLFDCRLAMLGLDGTIENLAGKMLETIKRRCTSCDYRKPCELDLRRDPNDPVWETYCPIAATLIALTDTWSLTH